MAFYGNWCSFEDLWDENQHMIAFFKLKLFRICGGFLAQKLMPLYYASMRTIRNQPEDCERNLILIDNDHPVEINNYWLNKKHITRTRVFVIEHRLPINFQLLSRPAINTDDNWHNNSALA